MIQQISKKSIFHTDEQALPLFPGASIPQCGSMLRSHRGKCFFSHTETGSRNSFSTNHIHQFLAFAEGNNRSAPRSLKLIPGFGRLLIKIHVSDLQFPPNFTSAASTLEPTISDASRGDGTNPLNRIAVSVIKGGNACLPRAPPDISLNLLNRQGRGRWQTAQQANSIRDHFRS